MMTSNVDCVWRYGDENRDEGGMEWPASDAYYVWGKSKTIANWRADRRPHRPQTDSRSRLPRGRPSWGCCLGSHMGVSRTWSA